MQSTRIIGSRADQIHKLEIPDPVPHHFGAETGLAESATREDQPVGPFAFGRTLVRSRPDVPVVQNRIFAEVQKLGGSEQDATAAPVAAPKTKHAPTAKAKPVKAAKKASAAKKAVTASGPGPRETSKTAQLIEMLRTKGGATLDGICKRFGWQKHTTRALMSAGGSLTKKHGINVISEKVGDSRTYRIAR